MDLSRETTYTVADIYNLPEGQRRADRRANVYDGSAKTNSSGACQPVHQGHRTVH